MIRLAYDRGLGFADVVLTSAADAVAHGDQVTTAILLSLYTDRRVDPSEVPAGTDLGGWWGATFPKKAGHIEGSRLWLLFAFGGAASEENRRRAEEYAAEALAWMIEDGIFAKIEPVGSIVASDMIELAIAFTEADGSGFVAFADVPLAA